MPSLKELFAEKRSQAIDDCVDLIDAEVKDKGGLSGMAIKAGYAVVNGVKPTFVREAVDHLLDEFADKLDPIYQEAKQKNEKIAPYFEKEKARAADGLLQITDEKAKRSKSGSVVKTYEKLRGTAKQHVESAMPRIGKLVEKYDR